MVATGESAFSEKLSENEISAVVECVHEVLSGS
jgi:hypothetical protein